MINIPCMQVCNGNLSKKEIYQIAKSVDLLEPFSNDNQLFALIVHPT